MHKASAGLVCWTTLTHNAQMTEPDLPENIDLRFLAAQQARILAEMRDRFSALEIGVAALSADLKSTKETVEDISGRLEIVEGRLNIVDARLSRIEKHTGLLKA